MSQTQCDQIAAILRRDGKIDNFYCLEHRITLRLGARIFELRKRGWKIKSHETPERNCIYYLIEAPKEEQEEPKLTGGEITTEGEIVDRSEQSSLDL